MINFKDLKETLNEQYVLNEALLPHQKAEVDTWEQGDNSFSNHLYKRRDNHKASFDLEHPTAGHISEVESHFETHAQHLGIKIHDYQKGIAKDKYGRDVNIGKLLHKTKAPDELKQKFENDPSRQQLSAKSDTHEIVISRHPHHVAGMTSHGHSWENSSCMNFSSGQMRHHLPHDVKQGTHVAYLVKKGDKNIENPLSRIALKRYTNIENPDDHILRPEHRVYGDAPDGFHHTLNKVINEHFPGDENAVYMKHKDVYDDSGNKYVIGKGAIERHLDSNNTDLLRSLARHPDISTEHLDTLLKNKKVLGHPEIRDEILKHKKINPETLSKVLDKAIKNRDVTPIQAMVQNPNLSSDMIDRIHDNSEWFGEDQGHLQHDNLSKSAMKKAMNSDNSNHHEVLQNPNISQDMIHDLLGRDDLKRSHFGNLLSNPNAKNLIDEHIARKIYHESSSQLLSDQDEIRSNIAKMSHLPKDLVHHYLYDINHNQHSKMNVLHARKDIDRDTLTDLRNKKLVSNRALSVHPNAPDEWFEERLKNPNDRDVLQDAVRFKRVIPDEHMKDLVHNARNFRSLTKVPNFSERHYKHFYSHPESEHRRLPLLEPGLSSQGLHDYFDANEEQHSTTGNQVGYLHDALNHPNLNRSHIKRMINHPDFDKLYMRGMLNNSKAFLNHLTTNDITKLITKHPEHVGQDRHFILNALERDKISPDLLQNYIDYPDRDVSKLAKQKIKGLKNA